MSLAKSSRAGPAFQEPVKYFAGNPVDAASMKLNSIMYLQVSITGQLVIFNTRTRSWFWTTRPSAPLMCAFVIAQVVATMISVYADWFVVARRQLRGKGAGH
jgi:hypothetical protein